MLLILFTKFSVIASPELVLSNKHHRHLTLESCLIQISPNAKLKCFILNLEAKSIHFVLPLLISVVKQDMNHRHREKNHIWQLLICYWHILKTRVTKKWGLHRMIQMKVEKKYYLNYPGLICWLIRIYSNLKHASRNQ